MDDQEYSYLTSKISKLTNIDLDAYKSQQMRRRLDGFISRSNAASVADYCHILEQDREGLRDLVEFLTINVSEFFRDQQPFHYLKDTVLPELLKKSPRLNIWSAACSCGQEPYSVAIILEELRPRRRHRILATDIDAEALERARQGGPYPAAEVRNVDQQRLRLFFTGTDKGYWITDSIRSRVEFRRHNLLRDPAERGFDLVVCRNVIIYFSEQVRDRLYREFHRSLKVDGLLFTGGTEVMLRAGDMGFANMSPSFYRKLPASAAALAQTV